MLYILKKSNKNQVFKRALTGLVLMLFCTLFCAVVRVRKKTTHKPDLHDLHNNVQWAKPKNEKSHPIIENWVVVAFLLRLLN